MQMCEGLTLVKNLSLKTPLAGARQQRLSEP